MNEYEEIRKQNINGFAHCYLWRCDKESNSDKIDIQVYNKLVQLDSKLGTTASKQLLTCLKYTSRSDIIKVLILTLNKPTKIILDYNKSI